MRLVNRQEMLELPKGTIYSHWKPCFSTGLFVHCGLVFEDDWYEKSVLPEPDVGSNYNAPNYETPVFDNSICREAMFDNSLQYAVYEPEDVRKLGIALGFIKE